MTYDLMKAEEIYHELKAKDPDLDHKLVHEWKDKMPTQFSRKMFEYKHGCHIYDDDLYVEATSYLENPDSSYGPHWSVDTIKTKSGIDFHSKEYTPYDYAYVVNMLYSDYGNIFTEPIHYLKMAKNYLEDSDYFGNPSERAYHNAIKRIEYFNK